MSSITDTTKLVGLGSSSSNSQNTSSSTTSTTSSGSTSDTTSSTGSTTESGATSSSSSTAAAPSTGGEGAGETTTTSVAPAPTPQGSRLAGATVMAAFEAEVAQIETRYRDARDRSEVREAPPEAAAATAVPSFAVAAAMSGLKGAADQIESFKDFRASDLRREDPRAAGEARRNDPRAADEARGGNARERFAAREDRFGGQEERRRDDDRIGFGPWRRESPERPSLGVRRGMAGYQASLRGQEPAPGSTYRDRA